jgi:hypothetical protein
MAASSTNGDEGGTDERQLGSRSDEEDRLAEVARRSLSLSSWPISTFLISALPAPSGTVALQVAGAFFGRRFPDFLLIRRRQEHQAVNLTGHLTGYC